MNRRKALICIPTLGHGGAENIIVRLCNGLLSDFDVDLLLMQRCAEDVERIAELDKRIKLIVLLPSNCSTISLGFRVRNIILYIFGPLIAFWLFWNINLRSYHIIHVNLTQFSLYSIIWGFLLKKFDWVGGIIQTFHTNQHLLKPLSRRIFRLSWKFCDCLVIEIDESEVSKVRPYIEPTRIRFIPFSVPEIPQQDHHSSSEVIQWGSLARLRLFEKKYDEILQALKILKNKGILFNYHIGGDGPDRKAIEDMVDSLGLAENVKFHGYISNPINFFTKLDGFIVATVGIDSGIAGLQALSSGIPIFGLDTLCKGNVENPNAPFKVAGTALELSQLLIAHTNPQAIQEYFKILREHMDSYIGDKVMIQQYKILYNDMSRPKVDLAFMADYGRRAGKGLEVQSIQDALLKENMAGVCSVRGVYNRNSSRIRPVHWTNNHIFRLLSAYQKYIWKRFSARYAQELLFDWACAKFYSKRIVPSGQILYLVPRMPKTVKAAKAAGYIVILHAAEMAPHYNIEILRKIYGSPKNWPSIWSSDGLRKAIEAIKDVDGVIAHTNAAGRSYMQMGFAPEKIQVTPMGYELSTFDKGAKNLQRDGITRYLYLGNVTKMKGSHLLLESWHLVSDERCELHICGEVYEDMLSDVNKAKHQFDNIYFHGYVDPSPYFRLCSVFVFPSLSESFGKAMLEAATAGLPLLCNRNIALNDVYEENGFGIYFGPDSNSMAEAMNFIKGKFEMQHEMGIRAVSFFQDLTWSRFGIETINSLRRIVN